jgi:hypothetical protein
MSSITDTDDTLSVSQRVVEKVAAETEIDPLEMEPLYTRVDPDCLESLFRDDSMPGDRNQGHIAFPMAGCEVVVEANGAIDVTPYGDAAGGTSTTEGATMSSAAVESPD